MWTVGLFLVEVCIAVFLKDKIIRPFVGDVLVVILLYTFFRTFLKFPAKKIAIGVLLLAFTIEFLQYFNFVDVLGIPRRSILGIALGSTFDVLDLLAYTLGILIVWFLDRD